jgi:hypothetical protein
MQANRRELYFSTVDWVIGLTGDRNTSFAAIRAGSHWSMIWRVTGNRRPTHAILSVATAAI